MVPCWDIILRGLNLGSSSKILCMMKQCVFSNGQRTEDRKYLGGFIGNVQARRRYVSELVKEWCNQLTVLADIAKSEPQAAYAGFVTGFQHKLNYHLRVLPNIEDLLSPLDDIINSKFIPAISDGHICSVDERLLLSLPVRLGGLGLPIFAKRSQQDYNCSLSICQQLITNIKQQTVGYVFDNNVAAEARKEAVSAKNKALDELANQLRSKMTHEQLRAHDLSMMKGASNWLTALPLEMENFLLNKREFADAIALRYRWQLKRLPAVCHCGKPYNVDHALNCLKGGFIHQRHDRLRNVLANVLSEVQKDVAIEPLLIPLTGEILPDSSTTDDEARLDIGARGFWQEGQQALFDLRIFNPFASSYLQTSLVKCFDNIQREKKRKYNPRVNQIEHGSFSPLVFTPYGGMGREAEHFVSTLFAKLALKRNLPYASIVNWLRSKISFALIRSAILCVRGTRDWRKPSTYSSANIELAQFITE